MERQVIVNVHVPSALKRRDIVPYVARKLRRLGFHPDKSQDVRYLPLMDDGGWWSADVQGSVAEDGVANLERHPLVRGVSDPKLPVSRTRGVDPFEPYEPDEGDLPGGAIGPPPMRRRYAIPLRILGWLIYAPLAAVWEIRSLYHRYLG